MAFLPKHHIQEKEFGPDRTYTHFGVIYGFVPIYIGDPEGAMNVAVRNWWPEWLLDAADAVFRTLCTIAVALNSEFEPTFPITIQGEIKRS